MKILKYLKYLLVPIMVCSLFGAEIKMHYEPEFPLIGDPNKIRFDESQRCWINSNYWVDSWMWQLPRKQFEDLIKPFKVPAKKKYTVILKAQTYRKPTIIYYQAAVLGAIQKKRLVLVNAEANPNMAPSVKIYPHLGIMAVGTAAEQQGWDVTLHDELVQGPADLPTLLQPGDVLGLSLVITGVERGLELAAEAKRLGAACVIAGNDSAIFRCNQLLALPGKPIDAIFTSNSLNSIRVFFQQYEGSNLELLEIPEMKIRAGGPQHSNRKDQLLVELAERKTLKAGSGFDQGDVFITPNFKLYPDSYWQTVWTNYRRIYGDKHPDPETVRDSLILLAQGCTRTQGTTACSYCSIYGIGDIRIPSEQHLAAMLDAYNRFGITEYYNATDSAFEMAPLVRALENIGASFGSLQIYARAQGLSSNPKLLERWQKLVRSGRFLLNVGIDSGDEQMLASGVGKSSVTSKVGSRLEENRDAIRNIRASGAHLYYSLIFGSPGESKESCERSLEFLQWSAETLGPQLDQVESDLYWLNFGSPASQVFSDYAYAQELATKAGKTISPEQWQRYFGSHANDLVVAWESEKAWYEFFTRISLEDAQEYNQRVIELLRRNEVISGRAFYPKLEG